jgi:hypothetical protein
LANNLRKLFDQYGLKRKIVIDVKNEGLNLNTMTIALKSTVKCENLGLNQSFQSTCFGYAFFKAC